MKYTSRGLKRRGDSDKWHVTLSHKDPITGELVPSYHTVTARTEKQAMKRRDELILDLERKGGAYTSRHDHRMVMALKVAQLGADGPIQIDDELCVAKSFPDFHL